MNNDIIKYKTYFRSVERPYWNEVKGLSNTREAAFTIVFATSVCRDGNTIYDHAWHTKQGEVITEIQVKPIVFKESS